MSLRPVTIEQFPGLDLRADPGDSRGAIDASNVTITPGRIATRAGTALLYTTATAPIFMYASERAGLPPHLLIGEFGSPGKMTAVTSTGTLVASSAGVSITNPLAAVNIGTATADYTYVGNPNIATLTRWDGALWTFPVLPAAIPSAHALGVTPADNRLAVGYHYRVDFSDPGVPETFGANNFVLLDPGDGDLIKGMCSYNNQLFVFKSRKYYVFYGTSTDSAGSPIFNYRRVASGLGITKGIIQDTCCTGPDGAYFLADDGVYKTSGGAPVRVSTPLDPFFTTSGVSPFWQLGTIGTVPVGLSIRWFGDVMYLSVTSTVGRNILFVYDRSVDAWSCWDKNVRAMAPIGSSGATFGTRAMAFGDATTAIVRQDPTLTADNGTAIVSRYRLPFETYGTPGEKRIRETILEGTGTPTVQWSKDWGSLVTGSAVTLGTSPAIAVGRQRLAIRGRAFSLQLGAASGAWAVNRVQPNLGEGIRGVEVTV